MKDLVIDCILVGCILFMFHTLFGNNALSMHVLEQDIVAFEEAISREEVIQVESGYDEMEDNGVAKAVLYVSQACLKIIQTLVLLISRFISKLL